jgi:hypothetical protein
MIVSFYFLVPVAIGRMHDAFEKKESYVLHSFQMVHSQSFNRRREVIAK